jgi:hypothetical protein
MLPEELTEADISVGIEAAVIAELSSVSAAAVM